MEHLGSIYENEKNYKEARNFYHMAISKDSVRAMILLGTHYDHIEKNFVFAKKWYLNAANKGCVKGMYILATFLKNHEKNYTEAKKWYEIAGENFHTEALIELAKIYSEIDMDEIATNKVLL